MRLEWRRDGDRWLTDAGVVVTAAEVQAVRDYLEQAAEGVRSIGGPGWAMLSTAASQPDGIIAYMLLLRRSERVATR